MGYGMRSIYKDKYYSRSSFAAGHIPPRGTSDNKWTCTDRQATNTQVKTIPDFDSSEEDKKPRRNEEQ